MNKILEYKDFIGSVKDIDFKNRVVTGYLSSFCNIDYAGDIIQKGAFSKSIKERKEQIYFLNQHKWEQPHGKFSTLVEDDKGLYFESTPMVKGVSYSEDVLKLYDAGVLKEHSIGFITLKSDIENNNRIIKEIKLFEGSNVTLGANSNTPFTGLKNMTFEQIEDRSRVLYKAIKNGNFTDETFVLLEYALKELQLQAYLLGKKEDETLSIEEPLNDTLDENSKSLYTINEFIKNIKSNGKRIETSP